MALDRFSAPPMEVETRQMYTGVEPPVVNAFQLPIVLFLAAIFVVAEITLSAER